MPKLKTNRGAATRFKKTGGGGYKRGHSHHSHILTKKDPKRKRGLRKSAMVAHCDKKSIRQMLPR